MSEQVLSGYVWNCFTKSRDGDGPLFVAHDDTVTARLDGYAVVPREEYDAALARIVRLEAALRPFAAAGEAHKVSSTIVAPEQWRAASAALADAPGEKM